MSRKPQSHEQESEIREPPRQVLIDSRRKYKEIVDNLPHCIFLKDKNGVYISCNKAFADDRGKKVNEIQGLSDYDLFPRHLAVQYQERDQQVLQADTRIEYEEYYPARESYEIVKILRIPVHGDQDRIIGVLSVLWSITKEKQFENALLEKEKQFRRFIDKATDAITLTDMKGKIVDANQKACEVLGYTYAELTAAHMDAIDPVIWSRNTSSPIWEKLSEENSVITESRYHRKDGSSFQVEVSMGLHKERGGHLVLSIARDITGRKKLEEQLFQSEKLATIAGLAAGVAHEINTPLSAILQSILVINNSLDSTMPDNRKAAAACGIDLDKVHEYFRQTEIDFFLKGMWESAIKASNIISNLLDFSRPQQGDMKKIDLNELLDSTISLARADYDLKKKYDILNFTILREYDPELPLVACMPMEIEQVLLNLVKNAVQAVGDGGSAGKPRLILRTGKEDGFARIEVEDNGPGIGEEEQKHIFDPFFTTKEVGVGTGLGLSVSFAIIHDKHHGTIEVESAPGKGAKFTVKIPVDKTADI
jgi:PAS domain S-box-containing protein